jgi:hypothetical protein
MIVNADGISDIDYTGLQALRELATDAVHSWRSSVPTTCSPRFRMRSMPSSTARERLRPLVSRPE